MKSKTCTPEQMAECPLRKHFADEHHIFWPRREYKTTTERKFRRLPDNRVQLCRNEHQEIHQELPPVKPSNAAMLQAIAEAAIKEQPDGQTETATAVYSGRIQTDLA